MLGGSERTPPGAVAHDDGPLRGGRLRRLIDRWLAAGREPAGLDTTLEETVADLARRQRDMAFLGEAGQLFQACRSIEELCAVGRDRLKEVSPALSGSLHLIDAAGGHLENVMAWGAIERSPACFLPDDCWSLRRGRPHRVGRGEPAVTCAHVGEDVGDWHLCLPLLAQGGTLGVLHFRADLKKGRRDEFQALTDATRLAFYTAIAETLSLAVANIRLRDTLRQQAIRDPLTGLFNRRYFEETLRRELHRALRGGQPLSVVLLDVDHFKRFNDTFGHDAGDAALKTMGELLAARTRAGDVACRHGGEEFALAFPGLPADVAARRVEDLRLDVAAADIRFLGEAIGPVTISAGIAVFPDHARDYEGLMRLADRALYRSKEAGRNRFTMASVERRGPEPQAPLSLVHDAAAPARTKTAGD